MRHEDRELVVFSVILIIAAIVIGFINLKDQGQRRRLGIGQTPTPEESFPGVDCKFVPLSGTSYLTPVCHLRKPQPSQLDTE